jgi:hypothetical protein
MAKLRALRLAAEAKAGVKSKGKRKREVERIGLKAKK